MYKEIHKRTNLSIFKYIIIVIVVLTIVINISTKDVIEDAFRNQARSHLQQIKYCYLNSKDKLGDIESLKLCTGKVSIGTTGDVYVLDHTTLEFVVENSSDVPQHLYFTYESVGQYFYDWKSGEIALQIILMGKDSSTNNNASYKFDKKTEWLEWIYLPDNTINQNNYIVVHGVQSDEVLEEFRSIDYISFSATSILIFLLLIAHNAQYQVRRRNDDKQ